MELLIKKAKITDPNSPENGKEKDILIKNGIIAEIGNNIKAGNVKTFEAENLHVSPGWFDMQADFCDPGYEYKEDLQSGMKAAEKGGFTGVAILPSDNPATDNKSGIEYILNNTKNNLIRVFPYGAISKKLKGEEIAEMYDMHQAGAVAFCDGKNALNNENVLLRALLYTKPFNKLIISFPHNKNIAGNGMVTESKTSTLLGLQSYPDIAESIEVVSQIYLAEYTDAALHLMPISTSQSIEKIKQAKKKGIKISCGISAYHLLLNDELLTNFDSNYKVLPPLCTEDERKALIKALCNDEIDVICSVHTPQDEENKVLEFDHATYGIINLQTCYAVANTALNGKISQDKLIEKIAINPRRLLRLEIPTLKKGNKADLTLFDPNLKWKFVPKDNVSKSKNSPFFGKELIGKPLGVVNNNKLILNV